MARSRLAGLAFLVSCALLALGPCPGVAGAQTASRAAPRVGVIYFAGHHRTVVDGLRQGLRELGLEEGKQIVLEIREITDDPGAAGDAARELERAGVDLIYSATTSITVRVKRATVKTPIVFYGGNDPVAAGLVESLAKPGGRLTGVHAMSANLTPKRLEILKEIMPKLGRVLIFYKPNDPVSSEGLRQAREAARHLGVKLVERPVGTAEEVRLAVRRFDPREAQAYFHNPFGLITSQAPLIADAARAKRMPTMFPERTLVDRGALASYGHSFHEIGRMSAKHVQRILAGASPKDIPVENYDKIEFVLNLRTAREIGLTIPPAIRVRADRLIE